MSKFARLEVFHPVVKLERPGLMANTRTLASEFLSTPSGSMVQIRTSAWETYESSEINFDPEPEGDLKHLLLTRLVNNIGSAGFALHLAMSEARKKIQTKADMNEEGFSENWIQCIRYNEIDIILSALNPNRSFLVLRSSDLGRELPPTTEEGDKALDILTNVESIVGGIIDYSLQNQIPPVDEYIDDKLVGAIKLGSLPTKIVNQEVTSDFVEVLRKNILPAHIAIGPATVDFSS